MMIRAKYTKTGHLVYLSHLDLVRLFERAFRRASIPLAFTQGFNPHPMISFAAPLSVGISSTSEYVEVVLSETMDLSAFKTLMNETLPNDIQILAVVQKDEKATASLMQEAALMDYHLSFRLENSVPDQQLEEQITRFLSRDQVIILKKGKPLKGKNHYNKPSKKKPVDVLPLIKSFQLVKNEKDLTEFHLSIHVINQETVKPILILEKWLEENNLSIRKSSLLIERREIYRLDPQQEYVSMISQLR
jgi:radical SAM-linked protein